jgi:hypothetical protein
VQKTLWAALIAGNIEEALRQADIVKHIRGPHPPSPLAVKMIVLAAEMRESLAVVGVQVHRCVKEKPLR